MHQQHRQNQTALRAAKVQRLAVTFDRQRTKYPKVQAIPARRTHPTTSNGPTSAMPPKIA
jgi:hypothetical protein